MGTAVKTSDLHGDAWPKELPAGYEVRSSSISEELAGRFYVANSNLGRLGVPGLPVEDADAVRQEFDAAHTQVKELISSLGGDSLKTYRIRYTDGEIDYLVKKAEG